MAIVGHFDANILGMSDDVTQADLAQVSDQLNALTQNLQARVAASGATVHQDGVNTDCNALTHGKHVVFSDGANATTPAPAGLYLIEQNFLAVETAQDTVSQLAWRYSTGLLYTRIRRANVWTAWNRVG